MVWVLVKRKGYMFLIKLSSWYSFYREFGDEKVRLERNS